MTARGFTLMETLVALVIFSLASMALLDLYSGSARAKAAHDSLIARTSLGESLLLQVDLQQTFEASRSGANANGWAWNVTMVQVAPQLVRIDIKVRDRAGRLSHLQTHRLPRELGLEQTQ